MNDTSMLPIGEVSRRSGFSPDTLRYYERRGLIERPDRTSAGRRAYDDRAMARLRFIARAKDLGCSLDQIRTLVSAFDRDCEDVAGRLRALVDAKLIDSQARVAGMVAFTAQLQEVRQALGMVSAAGPCGPDCACSSTATERAPSPTLVVLGDAPAIACSLDHRDMQTRIGDWQAVLETVADRQPVQGGIRLTFGPDVDLSEVARLARAEWTCCSFFSFALTVDDRGVGLEVTAPDEAQTLITSVFGVAS